MTRNSLQSANSNRRFVLQAPLIFSHFGRRRAGTATEHRRDSDDLQEQRSMNLDREDVDVAEEDHSDLDIDFEEPGYGLSDGKISDWERVEAAMLILEMAGGGLSSPFTPFHSFPIPSTGYRPRPLR